MISHFESLLQVKKQTVGFWILRKKFFLSSTVCYSQVDLFVLALWRQIEEVHHEQ